MVEREKKSIDRIYRDYAADLGGRVILDPFRDEIVKFEGRGLKIGRVANLYTLFYLAVEETDPEGKKLLQQMQQIPMVEVQGLGTVVFLRNKNDDKALVSVVDNEALLPIEAMEKHPEFSYTVGMLSSSVGPFPFSEFSFSFTPRQAGS